MTICLYINLYEYDRNKINTADELNDASDQSPID